jgi:cysteine-rich repeat protein
MRRSFPAFIVTLAMVGCATAESVGDPLEGDGTGGHGNSGGGGANGGNPAGGGAAVGGKSGAAGSGDAAGTAGAAGSSGAAGSAGSGGAAGSSGAAGSAGTSGAAGSAGASGAAGSAGTSGAAGSAGASGAAGSAGSAGASGAAGSSGASGSAGAGGSAGSAGASGASGNGGSAGNVSVSVCPDGVVEGSEDCDDNNHTTGDGCHDCRWETNCDSNNGAPQVIACGQTKSGGISGNWNDVEGVRCATADGGQDAQLVFTPSADANVTARYTLNAGGAYLGDHGLFVLEGSCHTALCIGAAYRLGDPWELEFEAKAGLTYYIDVEAPANFPQYSVTLTCN